METATQTVPETGLKAAKARLLLVDDNKELTKILKKQLQGEGYDVQVACDAKQGLAMSREHKPDLVVLDMVMPGMDGLEFLKALRLDSQVPVLFLTGKKGEVNQVLGLKMGADDYVTKPFCFEALAARVSAVLRRTAPPEPEKTVRRLGRVTLDPERREVRLDGKTLALTIKEFDLLKALIEARGKVLSRDWLLNAVWGIGEDIEIRTRTVDQHIAGLRQKLGAEGQKILTVPHFGYRIAV